MTELERTQLLEDIQILTRILEAGLEGDAREQFTAAWADVLLERRNRLAALEEESRADQQAGEDTQRPGAASSRRRGSLPLPPAG